MNDFICESLGQQHNRRSFDCGVPVLNEYLARIAGQAVKRKAAAVFVVDSKGESATGFYARFGFVSLPSLPHRMFLPLATAEKL